MHLLLLLLLQVLSSHGDYCEPNCQCSDSPLISVQCLDANLMTIPNQLNPGVQNLKLKYNNFKQIGSASFQFHPDLVSVDLSHNNLNYIQEKTFEAQKILIDLNLSNNQLTKISDLTFYGLETLEFLDLSQNQISELGNFSFEHLHKLKELNLNFNKITSITVNAFSGLNHLSNLNLGHNNLYNVPSEPLSLIPSLIKLDISFNMITVLGDGSFSFLTQLRNLDLSDNPLQEDGYSGNSFMGLNHLSSLDLSGINASTLSEDIFKELSSLSELFLDRNNIEYVSQQIFAHQRQLQVLSLSTNSRLTKIHPLAFQQNLYLTKIDLSSNKALSTLSKQLLENLPNLSQLNVSGNSLASLTLPNVTKWTSLDLSNNPWTCDCDMVSVYLARVDVVCHQPRGVMLSHANMSTCINGHVSPHVSNVDTDTSVTTLVIVTVSVVMVLTLVGVVGCRYQDQILSMVTTLVGSKCGSGHQEDGGGQWNLDTEQFIHISASQYAQYQQQTQHPTRPIPVTEL